MQPYEMMRRAAERTFDAKRRIVGADTCDLIGPIFTEGGGTGDSITFGVVASNLEVFVREVAGASAQTVIGGAAYVSSHGLEFKRTPVTLAITPEYKVRVYARNGSPERVFEKPAGPAQSFDPILVFKATLVRQGSQ